MKEHESNQKPTLRKKNAEKKSSSSEKTKTTINVLHDRAAELAQLIEKTNEYRIFEEARLNLLEDQKAFLMFSRFRSQQFQLQLVQRVGEDIGEKMKELDDFYSCIYMEPLIGGYIDAERNFMQLLFDVQSIFARRLELWPGLGLPWNDVNEKLN